MKICLVKNKQINFKTHLVNKDIVSSESSRDRSPTLSLSGFKTLEQFRQLKTKVSARTTVVARVHCQNKVR